MISITRASKVQGILTIASHEGEWPKIGQVIRYMAGKPNHHAEREEPIEQGDLNAAKAYLAGELKLPRNAGAKFTAHIVRQDGENA